MSVARDPGSYSVRRRRKPPTPTPYASLPITPAQKSATLATNAGTAVTPAYSAEAPLAPPPIAPISKIANRSVQRIARLSQPEAAKLLVHRQASTIWKQLGGHGDLPKIEVTPVNLEQKAPKRAPAGIAPVADKNKPTRIFVSQEAVLRLGSPDAQAHKATQEALTAALKGVQSERAQERKAALRSVLGSLTPAQRPIARGAIAAQRKTGVPASLLTAVSGQESAYGTNRGPSSAGAREDFQFIPETRQMIVDKYGVDPWALDAKGNPDEKQQALAAALYLRDLGVNRDPQAALSSYSGGYSAGAYNNPILESAKQFAALDRFAGRGGKLPEAPAKVPGPWAGAQHAVLTLIPHSERAEGRGDKRTPSENASVGGAEDSDHLTTNTKAYAADIPPNAKVYATLRARLGLPPAATGEDTVVKAGYRYQLIFGAQYGHEDHIHLGAEWVGAGIPEGTTLGGPVSSTGAAAVGLPAPSGGYSPTTNSGLRSIRERRRGTPAPISPITPPVTTSIPMAGQSLDSTASDPLSGLSAEQAAMVEAIMRRAGIL